MDISIDLNEENLPLTYNNDNRNIIHQSLRQQQQHYTDQAVFIQFKQKHKKSSCNVYRKSNKPRKKPTHSILPHKLKAAFRKSILETNNGTSTKYTANAEQNAIMFGSQML